MLYKVLVSFHTDFIRIEDDEIKIGILTKPFKGEANIEITKKIAKHFGINTSRVKIVAGKKSRDKVVKVII